MKVYEALSIDRNSEEPMYIQVYEGIKRLIENEALAGDEKLPAIRSFANRLSVNNVTIVNAYKLLEQKGYVYSRVGKGTFVKGKNKDTYNVLNDDFSDEKIIEQGYIKKASNDINFSTSTPNPDLFPVGDFKKVLNEVLDRDGGYAFGYQESQGFFPLRESISEYIKIDGINIEPSDVQVISGAQQGIDIVAKTLIGFNDTIVVESPTYTGAIAVFKSRGANIVEVPMREDGIDTKELEEVLKSVNPKLIYVMTNFQNPTGVSYSQEKKLQLLYLAQKYNTYILEDDYLSELRFYEEKGMPIKALDNNSRIIYLKSFSKIFMPGIRLGFLIVPRTMSRSILSAKHNSDISSSSLMQRAFDLYLRKKLWSNHLQRMLDIYKKRYDNMVSSLRNMSFVQFDEPFGGTHIWAKTDIDALMLSSVAKQKGILIAPGSVFYIDDRKSNYFRLSFAGAEDDDIKNGIQKLNESYMDLKNMNTTDILPFL